MTGLREIAVLLLFLNFQRASAQIKIDSLTIDYPIFFVKNGIRAVGVLNAKESVKIKNDSSNHAYVNQRLKKTNFIILTSRINLFSYGLFAHTALYVYEDTLEQTDRTKSHDDGYFSLLPKLTIVFVEMRKKYYDQNVKDSSLIKRLWDKSKKVKIGTIKKEGTVTIIKKEIPQLLQLRISPRYHPLKHPHRQKLINVTTN